MSRSVLRHHIRVASLQELKECLNAALDFFNRNPVAPTWSCKMDLAERRSRKPLDMIRNLETMYKDTRIWKESKIP